MKKINMNKYVKVKLTPLGADIYYHQYDDVNAKMASNGGAQIEPHFPEVDKDGFTEFLLWEFMQMYGCHIGNGCPEVISEIYIYMSDDDLEEASHE